jgi:hypothetical protein
LDGQTACFGTKAALDDELSVALFAHFVAQTGQETGTTSSGLRTWSRVEERAIIPYTAF